MTVPPAHGRSIHSASPAYRGPHGPANVNGAADRQPFACRPAVGPGMLLAMPGNPPSGFTPSAPALTLRAMNDAGTSDEGLMLAWVAGEIAAFEQLYARHRTRLYRYLLRHLRDGALADEMFQDVWQKVIAARAGWVPDAPFGTWLYRIAHNRLADHWRAAKHRPPTPEDGDERAARIPDPDTPERSLSEFEQRRQLQLALDELPPEQREVLVLRLEQDLSLEEIGAITGVGRETVKSRLRYAMDKLRARLGPAR